jgi:hypothetical protein
MAYGPSIQDGIFSSFFAMLLILRSLNDVVKRLTFEPNSSQNPDLRPCSVYLFKSERPVYALVLVEWSSTFTLFHFSAISFVWLVNHVRFPSRCFPTKFDTWWFWRRDILYSLDLVGCFRDRLSFVINKLIKLKLSHYTPGRRLGGEEVKLLLIPDLGTRWGCGRASLAPGKEPRYPLYRRLSGPQIRSGHKRLEQKSFRLFRVSNLDRPACSQTLYWLSYPADSINWYGTVKYSKSI